MNKISMTWHYKNQKYSKEINLDRMQHCTEKDILFHLNLTWESLVKTMKDEGYLHPLKGNMCEPHIMLECKCGALRSVPKGRIGKCDCGRKFTFKKDNLRTVYEVK